MLRHFPYGFYRGAGLGEKVHPRECRALAAHVWRDVLDDLRVLHDWAHAALPKRTYPLWRPLDVDLFEDTGRA